jgi:hypothetical protein
MPADGKARRSYFDLNFDLIFIARRRFSRENFRKSEENSFSPISHFGRKQKDF